MHARLLERDRMLAGLARAVGDAAAGARPALACDDLIAPRTLGPLRDGSNASARCWC
jgi:hypothetical protein